MTASAMVFYLFASVAVVSAAMVVTRRNAVHAALFLVLTFFCVAGIYVLQSAEFLAAVQVLVYAGGIMVLYLFVIMLVPMQSAILPPPARHVAGSLLAALLLGGALIGFFWGSGLAAQPPADPAGLSNAGGNIETVGMELYTRYLLPFEIASVLLLVAMIGAVVMARKKV